VGGGGGGGVGGCAAPGGGCCFSIPLYDVGLNQFLILSCAIEKVQDIYALRLLIDTVKHHIIFNHNLVIPHTMQPEIVGEFIHIRRVLQRFIHR